MSVIKIVAFALIIMTSSVSGRSVLWLLSALSRRVPPTSTPENQTIIASAKEYLDKFGWMQPSDWSAVSPRFNETTKRENMWNMIQEHSSQDRENYTNFDRENARKVRPIKTLPPGEFRNALKTFQRANGLRVTGILDDATMKVMRQLRCGVPDQTLTRNNTELRLMSNPMRDGYSINQRLTHAQRTRRTIFKQQESSLRRPVRSWLETKQKRSSSYIYLGESNIFEGELPRESRIESMRKMMDNLNEALSPDADVTNQRPISSFPASGLLARISLESEELAIKRRRKRSDSISQFRDKTGWGMAFSKPVITWRLMRQWQSAKNQHMSYNEVWFSLKLAFRVWSEVFPRSFLEDNVSPVGNVDILIGFGSKTHNRCPVAFKSGILNQEYAHAWPLPKAEIHFNDDQQFVPATWLAAGNVGQNRNVPVSLLTVAIHEIGHTLGLVHNKKSQSIMNPYYRPIHSGEVVELSVYDRENIKQIYGTCDITFDAVFDWVRQTRQTNGAVGWKYNTFFFQNAWYWLYDNRMQRPRYGDPRMTSMHWPGVLDLREARKKIDGVVQIRTWKTFQGPTFFFKGDVYVEYDNVNDRAKTVNSRGQSYPRRIAEDFVGIPYPIDAVFFHFDEGLLYFFKSDKVYRYSWSKRSLRDSALISKAFPGWGGATSLPNNIDAAYYSFAYNGYYFFKGPYFWKLAGRRERSMNPFMRIPYNAVGPRLKTSSQWKYICNVGPSEMLLTYST